MTYEMAVFAKLADNGLSGCTLVVGLFRLYWEKSQMSNKATLKG